MANLSSKVLKQKRLQKLGTALVVIIPKIWLNDLNWTRETNLIVCYHADDKKIIISENFQKINGEEEIEKISDIEPI